MNLLWYKEGRAVERVVAQREVSVGDGGTPQVLFEEPKSGPRGTSPSFAAVLVEGGRYSSALLEL